MKLESPQERLENIRQQLERDLKDHVVTVVSDTERVKCWRCAKPGTWIYGFYVTVIPGYVIIAGDIGEIVFQPTHPDPLDFIKGGDAHYQLGKAASEYREKQGVLPYYVREALAMLVASYRQNRLPLKPELKKLCRDMRKQNYDPVDRDEFYHQIIDIEPEAIDSICSVTVPDFGVLYRVYALQWFGRRLAQRDKTIPINHDASPADHMEILNVLEESTLENGFVSRFISPYNPPVEHDLSGCNHLDDPAKLHAQNFVVPNNIDVFAGMGSETAIQDSSPNCAGFTRPLDGEGKAI